MFTVYLAQEFGTDLSNRRAAACLRSRIEHAPVIAGCWIIDCTNVRTISDSFADELFAILVCERGHEWFKANVKLAGLSADVRETILEAVKHRLDTSPPFRGATPPGW